MGMHKQVCGSPKKKDRQRLHDASQPALEFNLPQKQRKLHTKRNITRATTTMIVFS
jgi:hypothetical protein